MPAGILSVSFGIWSSSWSIAATSPETAWEAIDEAPALFDIIDQTATVQINRYTIETIELLRSTFESWSRAAEGWEDPVGFHLVELDFTRPVDPAEREYLNGLPTSFRLSDEAIDRLRRAGRTTLRSDEAFLSFLEALEDEASATREPPAP